MLIVGLDIGSFSNDYESPNPFTGTIKKGEIHLEPERRTVRISIKFRRSRKPRSARRSDPLNCGRASAALAMSGVGT
jgi:hypothetical protein